MLIVFVCGNKLHVWRKFTLWFYKLCSLVVVNLLNLDFPYRENMQQGLSQSVQYLTNTEISLRGNKQDVETVYMHL
jgi:hypothetical protein